MHKQKSHTEDDVTLASLAGSSYAHLQHLMDQGIAWGFSKMKDVEKAPASKTDTPMGKASTIARSVISFFGKAGDSYYKTYEEAVNR